MQVTLNTVVKNIKEIANRHRQIHAFKFGDPWEFYTSGTADCAEMWMQIQPSPIGVSTTDFNFRIWLLDGVKRGEINELEVQSDMLQIAKDIIAQLNNPNYPWAFNRSQSNMATCVTESSPYKWSGVYFDINLKCLDPIDRCSIPFTSAPVPESGSGDEYVTIYNVLNGATITTVSVGGRYGVEVLTLIQDTIDSNTSTIIDPIS